MKIFAVLLTTLLLASLGACRPFDNPYLNRKQYVSPYFTASIKRSKSRLPLAARKVLDKVQNAPTSIWVVSKGPLEPTRNDLKNQKAQSLIGGLADAAKKKIPPLVTIIVYNLPNRDCAAGASQGEICCRYLPNGQCDFDGSFDCKEGLVQYRSFIDAVAENMKKYCSKVPMSVVVEPDSLPNLVTNLGNPRCSSVGTMSSYRQGIKYAVQTLSKACKKATLYLDAAHGRWLGYEANADGFVREFKALKVKDFIRGFSTNVAGHNPVGEKCPRVGYCNGNQNAKHPCCKNDPCNMQAAYNSGFNEINYAALIHEKMTKAIPAFNPRFIIDTSRGSTKNSNSMCSTWCNPRGVGMGIFPTTKTADPSIIDAYVWLKVPGESDGCSQKLPKGKSCPRYDSACGSVHSIGSRSGEPRAPEAGDWFAYQLAQLANKADLIGYT